MHSALNFSAARRRAGAGSPALRALALSCFHLLPLSSSSSFSLAILHCMSEPCSPYEHMPSRQPPGSTIFGWRRGLLFSCHMGLPPGYRQVCFSCSFSYFCPSGDRSGNRSWHADSLSPVRLQEQRVRHVIPKCCNELSHIVQRCFALISIELKGFRC
jgi:hypothetical protein